MTVLLQRVIWWSIAPVSRQSTAGSLFILRMKSLRPERRSRRQSTAIHFLVCQRRKLKLSKMNNPVLGQLIEDVIYKSPAS